MMDNIDKPIKKKRNQDSNRLTLSEKAIRKAKLWQKQIADTFNGMVDIKRNAIILAILEDLPDKLTDSTLKKIKGDNLTDKKKAEWLLKQVEEAKKEGREVSWEDLIKATNATSKRAKRSKKDTSAFKKAKPESVSITDKKTVKSKEDSPNE